MKHIAGPVWGHLTMFNFMNLYVIDRGEALVVVDTGTGPDMIDGLAKSLADMGRDIAQVSHILITHEHYDHVGGLAALQKRVNATTVAHRIAAAVIRGDQRVTYAARSSLRGMSWLMWGMLQNQPPTEPARVDQIVDEGDSLDGVWPGLRVIALPGHSYGQIGFHLTNENILIGGDVVMLTPLGVRMPLRAASPDWDAAKESIRKVGELGADVLCVGHGSPLVGDASAKVAQFTPG